MENASIEGKVGFVIFKNEETKFFIATFEPKDMAVVPAGAVKKGMVTISGAAIIDIPTAGSELVLEGSWTTHPKYGQQFKVILIKEDLEASVAGQYKFLVNNINGLGPVKAQAIVDEFGKETFKAIRHAAEDQETLEGFLKIGVSHEFVEQIGEALKSYGADADAMAILASWDLTPGATAKLIKQYLTANAAVQVINQNPYQLIDDIVGFGFVKADAVALKIGLKKNSPFRIKAGIMHSLRMSEQNGHTCVDKRHLMFGKDRYLGALQVLGSGIQNEELESALEELIHGSKISLDIEVEGASNLTGEETAQGIEGAIDEQDKSIKIIEYKLSEKMTVLSSIWMARAEETIERVTVELMNEHTLQAIAYTPSGKLNADQVEAVSSVLEERKLCVITGGAGVGKTFVTQEIIAACEENNISYVLLSPTGKAAKRLSEMTGKEAMTIHRFLQYNPHFGNFTLDQVYAGMVIIDETSMVDSWLMSELLVRINTQRTSIVLVGDKNQLPPVGAGKPFQDIIESDFFPVFTLSKIMRQDDDSLIPINASFVLKGEHAAIDFDDKQMRFIQARQAEDVPAAILQALKESTFEPGDIQVLSPQRKGEAGIDALNEAIRLQTNKGGTPLKKFNRFWEGDRIIFTRNNYDIGYMNGDQGFIIRENLTGKKAKLEVNMDGELLQLEMDSYWDIQLAYAITIHKSQGSEWKQVIFPVHPAHTFMLSKNLVYTGITRGRYNVTLVGTDQGLQTACRKADAMNRATNLSRFLEKQYEGLEGVERYKEPEGLDEENEYGDSNLVEGVE